MGGLPATLTGPGLFAVPPPLDRWVVGIWTVQGHVPVAAEAVLPNGVVEVILNLGPPHLVLGGDGARRYDRAWVAGMQQGPLTIAATGVSDLVGIRFRPGGAAALLDQPVGDLTDRVVEADDLDHRDRFVDVLHDRLVAVPNQRQRVDAVRTVLLERLDEVSRRPDPRVAAAVARVADATSLRALAEEVGISHKHLIDRFRAEVGVTPSRLRRILRFDGVVRRLAGTSTPNWAAVAMDHGFSDQSHLVREFRTLAGVTPTTFLATRMDDQAHLDASALPGAG